MKNYFLKFSIIFILFSSFTSVFGQKNYLPGKIVNLSGDTVNGFIDYRDHLKNPTIISFKINLETNNIKEYKPVELISFTVADNIFESGHVKLEVSPFKTIDLKYSNKDFKYQNDTVFLRSLISGEKSLWYYQDINGKEHFYIKKGNKFELLEYKIYIDEDDAITVKENNKYIGQLNIYFKDYPKMYKKISGIKYKQNHLINLFKYYYKSIKPNETFIIKEKQKAKFEFGLNVGLSVSTLSFNSGDDYWDYLSKADFSTSVNPSFGAFFCIVLPSNLQKWSIYNELLYTSYEVEGKYSKTIVQGLSGNASSTFGYSYIKLNSLLNYQLNEKKTPINIKLGFSNGLAISEVNHGIYETVYTQTSSTYETEALPSTTNYEFGALAGIGVKYKRFAIEGRYEISSGMTGRLISISSIVNRIYFLMSYHF